MNPIFILYIEYLIVVALKKTALTLSDLRDEISHDKLTRALNTYTARPTLLASITKPSKLRSGYLVIDDTVLERPYGKDFEGASYVFSSTNGKAVYGYQLVLLIWTDGIKRIVIGGRLYKSGGLTKIQLALELLSYGRNTLNLKPEFVLFDSWYSSAKILKRIRNYGWYFVTQIKKNRLLDGEKLPEIQKTPYWQRVGALTGGLKVKVIRHGNKYFATNRLSLSYTEVLEIYRMRQQIEEVNKALKHCGLTDMEFVQIKETWQQDIQSLHRAPKQAQVEDRCLLS